MKKTVVFIALMLASVFTFAKGNLDKWPELKSFHEVMSTTFHPSEEGNLEPIKTKINEFTKRAHTLATSNIPAEFNNAKVKEAVTTLDKEAMGLKNMISKKASDAEIKAKLSTLHDTFHQIVGLCSKGE